MSGRRTPVVLLVIAALAVAVGIFAMSRSEPVPPFDVDSAAPDGWKAVRILLEERGVEVRTAPASVLSDDNWTAGAVSDGSDAVVMAVPSVATRAELDALKGLAKEGTLVVFGEPLGLGDDYYGALDMASYLDDRTLADEPASELDPGRCDMDEFDGLGDIDVAFVGPSTVDPETPQCYSHEGDAYFVRDGGDRSYVMASPYLWANARLQPRKEKGDPPQDNAATAMRLLGAAESVTFIDPVPSPGVAPDGTQDPMAMLPVPVKLALAQLVGALVLLVWWRSRRLGPPVHERMPVEIAGSELVVAVGDLMRRRGNPSRAAATVRAESRRVLAERLGMGPDPSPNALVRVVAARTGREPDEVGSALYGDPAHPVGDTASLVTLVRNLDAIRQEVLDVVHR